ncbi:alpha/beta fold hydrolase [Aldersonia sp. NBC_00410]|uniref:alpha/beta fold hydrolase n=1 Tax=Aldersonia sp. NBC_00410 TaxID=2975954 RepID=UPI002259E784|nr:alpha/beta fold hydrolase [Aldersonia sp. NBC_00410]MCX5041666.1 alpha/beta fold hydrolase [Aldersonia sp. NBC_00410]
MTIPDIRRGKAAANGLELAYEDMGDPDRPAVLLIMGFSAQLTLWPDDFCAALVDGGYRVIRFDNRDIGLSSKLHGVRVGGSTLLRMGVSQLGRASTVPYTVADMAADTVGLLDHLDIEAAHIVGASMGGMIAQVFAAEYPERVRSLGIVFSSTNQPLLPPPSVAAIRTLLASPGANPTREQVIAQSVRARQVIGSPQFPEAPEVLAERAARDYDRSYYPAGVVRQFAAVTGSGSLLGYSRRIDAPTVVIHGSADPLIRPAGGRAVARAVEGARLHVIKGMGHDLPAPLLPEISGELLKNFTRG